MIEVFEKLMKDSKNLKKRLQAFDPRIKDIACLGAKYEISIEPELYSAEIRIWVLSSFFDIEARGLDYESLIDDIFNQLYKKKYQPIIAKLFESVFAIKAMLNFTEGREILSSQEREQIIDSLRIIETAEEKLRLKVKEYKNNDESN